MKGNLSLEPCGKVFLYFSMGRNYQIALKSLLGGLQRINNITNVGNRRLLQLPTLIPILPYCCRMLYHLQFCCPYELWTHRHYRGSNHQQTISLYFHETSTAVATFTNTVFQTLVSIIFTSLPSSLLHPNSITTIAYQDAAAFESSHGFGLDFTVGVRYWLKLCHSGAKTNVCEFGFFFVSFF